MGVLQRFLRKTLVILALAIIGLVARRYAVFLGFDAMAPGLLIILAASRLWRDTSSVIREAARSVQTMIIIALVFLASPALAGPTVRCRPDLQPTLNRLQTLCDDGTRAVSTWSPTLRQRTDHRDPAAGADLHRAGKPTHDASGHTVSVVA